METEILMQVYEVIDELKQQEEYKRYKFLEDKLDNELISKFNSSKEKFESLRGGKHHPDYKKYSKIYIDNKVELMNNEYIKEYLELEKRIAMLLNNYSIEIANSISEEIKTPNEIGLLRGCHKK